jgi:predicted nuclease of predicted toxin-antitoxin system
LGEKPKFFIDEDMPRSLSRALSGEGFSATDVRDVGLRGAHDEAVFTFAQGERAVLVTGDTGFGNILHYPLGGHMGIIIVHFPNEVPAREITRQVCEAVKLLSVEDFRGNLFVIEPGRVRIRHGKPR